MSGIKTYRVINAGCVNTRTVWTLDSAMEFARKMCWDAEASSIITDPDTGKTLGGCDLDAQTGLPVTYWLW